MRVRDGDAGRLAARLDFAAYGVERRDDVAMGEHRGERHGGVGGPGQSVANWVPFIDAAKPSITSLALRHPGSALMSPSQRQTFGYAE